MLAITTDELIAKEAVYHPRCYRKYTIKLYHGQREAKNEKSLLQIAFDVVEDYLLELHEKPDVVEFKILTDVRRRTKQNKS